MNIARRHRNNITISVLKHTTGLLKRSHFRCFFTKIAQTSERDITCGIEMRGDVIEISIGQKNIAGKAHASAVDPSRRSLEVYAARLNPAGLILKFSGDRT